MSFNTKYLKQEIDVNFLCNSMMNMVLWKNEKPYCCRNVVCISFDVKNKKGVSNIFFFVLSRYNSKGVLMSRELLIILDNYILRIFTHHCKTILQCKCNAKYQNKVSSENA